MLIFVLDDDGDISLNFGPGRNNRPTGNFMANGNNRHAVRYKQAGHNRQPGNFGDHSNFRPNGNFGNQMNGQIRGKQIFTGAFPYVVWRPLKSPTLSYWWKKNMNDYWEFFYP